MEEVGGFAPVPVVAGFGAALVASVVWDRPVHFCGSSCRLLFGRSSWFCLLVSLLEEHHKGNGRRGGNPQCGRLIA